MKLSQEQLNLECQEMLMSFSELDSGLYDKLINKENADDLNILLTSIFISGKRAGLKIAKELLNAHNFIIP